MTERIAQMEVARAQMAEKLRELRKEVQEEDTESETEQGERMDYWEQKPEEAEFTCDEQERDIEVKESQQTLALKRDYPADMYAGAAPAPKSEMGKKVKIAKKKEGTDKSHKKGKADSSSSGSLD